MNQPPNLSDGRIDGWKAVASYFKRDRSTVMRWARERQLPVHRMPGGKRGSVFALQHELAAWALDHRDDDLAAPAPLAPNPAAPLVSASKPRFRWRSLALFCALLVAGGVLVALLTREPAPPAARRAQQQLATPRDPAAAADYVAARDAWARRTPPDIAQSIKLYDRVIRREPDFAPAYSGLADSWLVYREYGEVPDAQAYNAARKAAERALRLDANLASAHRALGFVAYWNDNDAPAALDAFARALRLNDGDAQTHFWYANVLADVGHNDAAEREYRRARLLLPGSQPIEVEYACAQWQAGRDAMALGQLNALAARYPHDATIRNCLAWVRMSAGDIRGFGREYALMAHIRNEPELNGIAAALTQAIARDPGTAHRVVVARHRRQIAEGTRRLRETPAFLAGSMGDRAMLETLLREGVEHGERWYSATLTKRLATRWEKDGEIMALLAQLRPPVPALPDTGND